MDNNGALLLGIQRVLGHADHRSTRIYLEKLRDVERGTMNVYERESWDISIHEVSLVKTQSKYVETLRLFDDMTRKLAS